MESCQYTEWILSVLLIFPWFSSREFCSSIPPSSIAAIHNPHAPIHYPAAKALKGRLLLYIFPMNVVMLCVNYNCLLKFCATVPYNDGISGLFHLLLHCCGVMLFQTTLVLHPLKNSFLPQPKIYFLYNNYLPFCNFFTFPIYLAHSHSPSY